MANGNGIISKSSAISVGMAIVIVGAVVWLMDSVHTRWDVIQTEVTRQTTRLDAMCERLANLEAADARQEKTLRQIEVAVARLQAAFEKR